ncbi:MAG: hypothetical protein ACFWTS_04280 [Pseudoclavibacter caeni]
MQRATGGTSVNVLQYTQAGGFQVFGTVTGVDAGVASGAIAGAVDPVSGNYLFAGWDQNDRFHIYGVNVNSGVSPQQAIDYGYFQNPFTDTTNGDFAFDKQGNLYVVLSPGGSSVTNKLFVIPSQSLSAHEAPLQAKEIASQSGQRGNFNGVAFDSTGRVFTQTTSGGNSIQQVNPNTMVPYEGTQAGINVDSPVDLGSCLYPGTVKVQKNYVATTDHANGRHEAGDQVQLSVQRQNDPAVTATTAGDKAGIQDDVVGPIIGVTGETYKIAEATATGADLAANYASTYDVTSDGQAQGSATAGTSATLQSFPRPTGDSGPDVVYTFNNTPNPVPTPGYEFSKSSDPVSGTSVNPGDVVSYTLTGKNTGETVLDPVDVSDDLSQVLAFADLQGEPVAKIGDQVVDAPKVDGAKLSWAGSLKAGESVSITYQVKVKADAAGKLLKNVANSQATPPGDVPPITPPEQTTENPVPTPGYEFSKSSDPVSGTSVNPGDVVSYTLTGKNTGETVLDPVDVSDDLSQVLAFADLQGEPVAKIGDQVVDAPKVDGAKLSWAGSLKAGESVSITYQVKVKADAAGKLLKNVANSQATPPGDVPPITPPEQTTENPVPTPGYEFSKSSDPVSGTSVNPGDVVSYTLTGKNTGETVLDPVDVSDDLSQVLAFADLQGEPVAKIGDQVVDAPKVDGAKLSWAGSLKAGESVSITYQVKVKADAAGKLLKNVANSQATPPGDVPPITPPEQTTENPVPTPGYEFSKSSDPVSGTSVNPGDVVSYTLTGKNTGETVLDPVDVSDDLSQVLAFADLQGEPVAKIGDQVVDAPKVDGAKLSWAGSLKAGESVSITYQVKVKADAAGKLLKNVANSQATPPGDVPPITPPEQTTENPVPTPGYEFSKSSDPVSGTSVNPGDVVSYTLTGKNTGETVLDPVDVSDDLSQVLAFADLQGEPVAKIGDQVVDAPKVDGAKLSWAGSLKAGESVSITYQVKVKADAAGKLLKNVANSQATPPGDVPPITPPEQTTENPVPTPGYEFSKSSDPVSGTSVNPGDVVSYTLTGKNTGETVLDPVDVSDDLSQVLAFADLQGEPVAKIGDQVVDAPKVDGAKLSWAGSLKAGESVSITYQVKVKADAAGKLLKNVANSQATPPGDVPPITPPEQTTENPVPTPGYEFSKSSDPVSGTSVNPGDVVSYTLTGKNTGETVLDPVDVSDDLSQVLAFADLQGEPVAKIGDQVVDAPKVDGAKLSWAGSLKAGESVSITYQVKVKADAAGKLLKNVANSQATPPGDVPPITPPEQTTENPVPTPGFTFVKRSDASAVTNPAKPGQKIVYSFEVANTGETVLTNVRIDDRLAGLSTIQYQWPGAAGVLQPGQKVTATADYAITDADIRAGKVDNSALAYGTPPGGSEVPSNPGKTHDPLTPPSPQTPLAKTGAEAGVLIGGAGLLAAGALLIEAARRKRKASAQR